MILLFSQLTQQSCGVFVCGDKDSNKQSELPVYAYAEIVTAQLKVEVARHLSEDREKLADFIRELDDGPRIDRRRIPLGLLATDHSGYCSFDLEVLGKTLDEIALEPLEGFEYLKVISGLWVAPIGTPPANILESRELQISPDGFLVLISVSSENPPPRWTGIKLPSLQTPRLVDWRFSPGSFSANPELLIGAEACENIIPAQHSLRTFRFAELIRYHDIQIKLSTHDRSTDSGPTEFIAHAGIALEYRTDWYHLGHSLGQVSHSQPLAPCESVKLAIINWSRQDDIHREDNQTVTENLLHEQYRDRFIEESVNATLREHQSGGSFMAGLGAAAQGAFSANAAGAAVLSIGGATSSSSGTRSIAANSVQKVTDTIKQATSATRDLYGTVVIQANQAEQNALETRTFTNNNHCHTLTILYYEVLRHLRVVTRCVAIRPILLVDYDLADFEDVATIRIHRTMLEPALLDARLAPGFDAAEKLKCLQIDAQADAKSVNYSFYEFNAEWITGSNEESQSKLWYSLVMKDGTVIKLQRFPSVPGDPALHTGFPFTGSKGGYAQSSLRPPGGAVEFSKIAAIRVEFFGGDLRRNNGDWVGGDWVLGALRFTGRHGGGEHRVFDGLLNAALVVGFGAPPGQNPDLAVLDIGVWSPSEGALVASPQMSEVDLPEPERCHLARLKEHLVAYKYYYSRIVWLTADPNERADLFDLHQVSGSSATLLDIIENRPLEVLGHSVAFPVSVGFWDSIQGRHGISMKDLLRVPKGILAEDLLTIPTRGLFAEAKLGHCNACEEIDDTKYWQWQESPCPCDAPEISDITPGPKGEPPKVDQSTMPSPVVNIVNPPSAPDPTGLANALTLLGTANAFRDMSMSSQLGSLLNTLAQQAPGLLKSTSGQGAVPGASGAHPGSPPSDANPGRSSTEGQPTVSPRTAREADKTIQNSGASPSAKQSALDQNVRNMVGLPKSLDAPRFLSFDVKWWAGGPDMYANFEVLVKDHDNLEYSLGTFETDGLFSATLTEALWKTFTDSGSLAGVRLIARDAKLPPRSLSLNLPVMENDNPTIKSTLPASIPILQQSAFSAPMLVGKTNNIIKPASGSTMRFTAVAARKTVDISVKVTLKGTGELQLEASAAIENKIAAAISLAVLAGGAGTAAGGGGGGPDLGSIAKDLTISLALKVVPKLALEIGGEIQLPITVEFLDHTTLNLQPVPVPTSTL